MKGTVITRTLKDGKTKRYDVAFRVGGTQKWRTFTKRKEADAYLSKNVNDVHRGEWRDRKPVPFGEIIDQWLLHLTTRVQEGSMKRSTASLYQTIIRSQLRPSFGGIRSDCLDHKIVGQWRSRCAARVSEGTLSRGYFDLMRVVLGTIIRWGQHPDRHYAIHGDPLVDFRQTKTSKSRRERRPFLEPSEIQALITAAPSPADTIIRVLAFTGLRPSELLVLTWGDIEWGDDALHGGRIHVRRRLYKGHIDSTKTAMGTRSVDIPQQLVDCLTAHRASLAPREPAATDYVFEIAPGRPISYETWNPTFKTIAKAAGLPHVRSYALRHAYASMLLAQGEDPRLVADQLGHTDPGLTLRVYAHALKKNRVDAMTRLGQRMISLPSTPI